MKKRETKTREYERKVTIATSAVCDFLRESKNTSIGGLNDGRVSRLTDYIHAVVDVWSELKVKVKPDLYEFTKEWISKDYATVVGMGAVIKVLVGVPNSDCKNVVFEY